MPDTAVCLTMTLYILLRPTFGITTVMNTSAPTRGLYNSDIGCLQGRDGHRYHSSSVSDPITVSLYFITKIKINLYFANLFMCIFIFHDFPLN